FTPAAQSVNLRGLGASRTLILIDGRRLPQYPLAQDGTSNFQDIGQIPVAAIERVEVMTDSGSAIYGSDAIGGVVNFI
ncbi:TonB-dependent receptor plug domain-containing protein, partial [Escherichia coli]|nr:TonB-dependent receptor plug domain-containing protein [Escherichia coli]